MAKLPSLVTSELTGEAMNYTPYPLQNSQLFNVHMKQVFEVTKNTNDYNWTVKSSLYIRLDPDKASTGVGYSFYWGLWQKIGNETFELDKEVNLYGSGERNPGIFIDGVKVSDNAYEYYKIMENTVTLDNNTGRKGQWLRCGTRYPSSQTAPFPYFQYYTFIYVTLPSYSGMSYKINGSYKRVMPWIKVNGTWKRAKQYIKIDGEWKEYNDSWIYNPEA